MIERAPELVEDSVTDDGDASAPGILPTTDTRDCSRCGLSIHGQVFVFRSRYVFHEECLLEVLPALLRKVAGETDACGECDDVPRVAVDIRNTRYCSPEHQAEGVEHRDAELRRLADEEQKRTWLEQAARVAAERDQARSRAAEDTANRYCRECWQEIGDPVCFLGDASPLCTTCFVPLQRSWDERQFRWWADDEDDDVPEHARRYDVNASGYDPLRKSHECEVCSRTVVGRDGVCSPDCRRRLRSVRRAQARDSEIPDFTCEECGNEITSTVVFWQGVRCEPCFTPWRIARDRETLERMADSPLRALFSDPDDPEYNVYKGAGEPRPCAGCGRSIRGAYVCSDRCWYEASLAKRRVPEHDPRQCEVCGELFTPKRADARTCSNACRQKAHRRRKAAG